MTVEELAKQEKREYFRKWREKNKDKVRENNRRYWERRAARRMEEERVNG